MVPTPLALALILLMAFLSGPSARLISLLQTTTPPGVQLVPSTLNFGKQVVKKPSLAKR